MPQSIQIGAFVLGSILLLIGLLGGNFKLFGNEIASTVANRWLRLVAFIFGLTFISIAFQPATLAPPPTTTATPLPPVVQNPTPQNSSVEAALHPSPTLVPTQESPSRPTPVTNPSDTQKANVMRALTQAWDTAIRARSTLDISALPQIFIGEELATEQNYVFALQQQSLFEVITPLDNLRFGNIAFTADGQAARVEVVLPYRAAQSSTITRQCVVQTSAVQMPMSVDMQFFPDGWKVGHITYGAPLPVGFPCQ